MTETIFVAQTPGATNNDPNSPRTLGIDFKSAVGGTIDTLRFYITGPTKPATVTVALYDPSVSTAVPMASASGSPSVTGWFNVALGSSQPIVAGHTYTAAAWISLGAGSVQPDYGFTSGGLASDVVNGDLTGLANTGRFANNTPSLTYPSGTSDFNLFVDVVFTPAGAAAAAGIWGVSR